MVSTVNLECELDLLRIALHARNAEYSPERFSAVVIRLREPKTTALVFRSGKLVCAGAKSLEASRLAARKVARVLQKIGFPVRFSDFRVQNLVATNDAGFAINLDKIMASSYRAFSNYEPEIFPGLIVDSPAKDDNRWGWSKRGEGTIVVCDVRQ